MNILVKYQMQVNTRALFAPWAKKLYLKIFSPIEDSETLCLPHSISWSLTYKSWLPCSRFIWFPYKIISEARGSQTSTVIARSSSCGYCAAIRSLLDKTYNKTLAIYGQQILQSTLLRKMWKPQLLRFNFLTFSNSHCRFTKKKVIFLLVIV